MDAKVSTRTTYILWFTLGWLGIHHLYLGRLYQAIVWFATLGGGCGIGWVRDAWRIPSYVKWCSPDRHLRKKYAQRAAGKTKTECSSFRSIGMTLMGFITSKALSSLIPNYSEMYDEDPVTYYFLHCSYLALCVFGNALGIYLVANIGELQCSFSYTLIISGCVVPIFVDITSTLGCSIATWIIKTTGLKWRSPCPEGEKQSKGINKKFWIHLSLYAVICLLWIIIVSVGFYFNGELDVKGQKMSGKEIISNVANSEIWHQLHEVYALYQKSGFGILWREITAEITIVEKVKSYWMLGIYPGTSSENISKRCRKLLAEHHPDRFKTAQEREEAEVKYVQINHACSYLTGSRSRKQQNTEF